jgi:hypothetical protein
MGASPIAVRPFSLHAPPQTNDFKIMRPIALFLLMAGALYSQEPNSSRTPYVHTFSAGAGGWLADHYYKPRIWDGVANCYSPWFVDANHAPPGAGYLHLVLWIWTDKRRYEPGSPAASRAPPGWSSSFVEQGKSRDLRNARLTVRLRGEVDLKGAQMVLLAQATTPKTTANMILTGQPIRIAEDWSSQTIVLADDPNQWTCLGARKGREKEYGCDSIHAVLADVNNDLIFVLFNFRPAPACQGADRPGTYAGVDYPVDQDSLPRGLIQFQSVRIDYPN